MASRDYSFKIVVLGDPSVGKTSLVEYYTHRSFKEFYLPTIGANFSIKEVDLEAGGDSQQPVATTVHVKTYIWDIAGQAKFASIRKMFYEQASAAIFVFDITNRKTLDSIEAWKKDLIDSLGADFPSAMVANKVDLPRKVSTEDGFEKAADLGMSYYETSAKTGQGVDDAFHNLLLLLIDKARSSDS